MDIFIPLYGLGIGSGFGILWFLMNRYNFLLQYQTNVAIITVSLITLSVILIVMWCKKLGVVNYIDSLTDTHQLRQFLKKQNSYSSFNFQKNVDVIQQYYNAALWHTSIKYMKDSMEVHICIPNNVDAAKLLASHLSAINTEVASYTDKYLLASPEREKRSYVITGTRN